MLAQFEQMQRGLVYPSAQAHFLMGSARDEQAIEPRDLGERMSRLRAFIHDELGSSHTSAVIGVGCDTVRDWTQRGLLSLPKAIAARGDGNGVRDAGVFSRRRTPFADSGADLWFHLKNDVAQNLDRLRDRLVAEFEDVLAPGSVIEQRCDRRNHPGSTEGRVLGCRFAENSTTPPTR